MELTEINPRMPPRWTSLTYLDFMPQDLNPKKGIFQTPRYERYDVLLSKANEWLSKNPAYKVVSCESYEMSTATKHASTNNPIVTNVRNIRDTFIRCLRLWVSSRRPEELGEAQQIGYISFKPRCLDGGGIFSKAKFERFGDILSRINSHFQRQPVPGRIINIETQDVKVHSSGDIDPDETKWTQGFAFLNVVRVYFLCGHPAFEQIGCADFVPNMTKSQGFTSCAEFEPLSVVMQKANAYIQKNPQLRIVNVQSMNYKMHADMGGPGAIDTHRSFYHEMHAGATHYLRIFRVYHVTGQFGTGSAVRFLTCKTFVPCQLSAWGFASEPRFESQGETMIRALAWLNATGARVISAETAPVQMLQYIDPENPYTYFHQKMNFLTLMVFKVYLDGYYPEPRPELLPPLPQITGNSCCVIL